MVIYIGSDHTGVKMKKQIVEHLKKDLNNTVIDLGPNSNDSVDYTEYGFAVGSSVASEPGSRGIVICGSGIGISIATNKVKGAVAALVYEEETTRLARLHNNANILATGARIIAIEKAINLVDIFLNTDFEGGRHCNRSEKLFKK